MNGNSGSGGVVIAGGSGFLGVSLATHLAAGGTRVVILSRTPPRVRGPWRHVAWDARTLGDWHRELDGAAGLVNLAGRTVDCIKTPDHQDEILRAAVAFDDLVRDAGQGAAQVIGIQDLRVAHVASVIPVGRPYSDSPSTTAG